MNFVLVKIGNLVVANTTPHPIVFGLADGQTVTVPQCGALVNATVENTAVAPGLVTPVFKPSEDGWKIINDIKAQHAASPDAALPLRIVGSVVAAQAYPMTVVGMVPCKGYERVAPAQKRMDPTCFTVFKK